MRLGDYFLAIAVTLNVCASLAYLYQRHYAQAFYWLAAVQLNLSLICMK